MSNLNVIMDNILQYLRTLEHSQYFNFDTYEQFESQSIVIRASCKLCGESILMNYDLSTRYIEDVEIIKYIAERISIEFIDKIKEHLLKNHIQRPFNTQSLPTCASTYSMSPCAGFRYDPVTQSMVFSGGVNYVMGNSGVPGSSGLAGTSGRAGSSGSSGIPREYYNNNNGGVPGLVMDYNEETDTVIYNDGRRESLSTKKSKFIDAIEKLLDLDDDEEEGNI